MKLVFSSSYILAIGWADKLAFPSLVKARITMPLDQLGESTYDCDSAELNSLSV
jgi:hypothetical protein